MPSAEALQDFKKSITELHTKKDALYGLSWCKRGELLSIFPNILRKSDRLQQAAEILLSNNSDEVIKEALELESLEDTLTDLFVYLCKYVTYLRGFDKEGVPNTSVKAVNRLILDESEYQSISRDRIPLSQQGEALLGITMSLDRLAENIPPTSVLIPELDALSKRVWFCLSASIDG